MNKLRYRVVFNRARGLYMAVSETARSNSKGGADRGTPGALPPPRSALALPALGSMRRTVMAAFGASAFLIGSASAQIVADPRAPGGQRPTVLNTANGVLQVNVRTPSAAGVSRNTYVQFDVPTSGAILNNASTDVQTQLGGWVRANPWVANGGARVILNEVNSTDPSHLRGYIEVAGPRADVIVANPAGIAVDGGGFINVSRGTLTTGTAQMDGGALDGFSVRRGEVRIEGAGLDASRTDYTALIARSVAINGALWAKQLNVTTGANQVSVDSATAAAQPASDTAPAFGIDVGQLGGMYANKIFLVGSEAGVGVRNAGEIGAAAGDLIVTSEGRLENKGRLLSKQQLDLRVRAVDNSGTVSGDGGVTLAADSLRNSGQIHSAAQAILALKGEADNSHGTIEAQRIEMTSASGSILNRQGKIVQSGSAGLDIHAAALLNTAGGQIGLPTAVAGGDAPGTPSSPSDGPSTALPDGLLRAAQTIDNLGGQISAGGAIGLQVGALDNIGGQLRLPSLYFDGSAFANRGGTLEVLQDFTAHTPSFDNVGGKLLIGEHFNASLGEFDNTAGLLQAGTWQVAVALGLNNSGGVLRQMGKETAALAVGGQLNNDKGTLESAGSMQLSAGSIAGSGSRLTTLGDLKLDSGAASILGATWNIAGSAIIRTGAFEISGIISAGKDLNVASAAVNNQAGTLYGASNVTIHADGALMNHDGGQIYSGGALRLTGQSIGNQGGSVKADGPALLSFDAGIDNTSGILQSVGEMTLSTSGLLTNDLGTMEVTSSLGKLGVSAQSITNGGGRIVNFGTGALSVNVQSRIANDGVIAGNGELIVGADTLQNGAAGVLASGKDMALAVRQQVDNAGEISSAGELVSAQDDASFNNRGNIVANGQVTISAAAIHNDAGRIASVKGSAADVTLAAQSFSNAAGAVMADGNASFTVAGALDNSGGLLQAGKDLHISAAGALDNNHAVIETLAPTSSLTINAQSIANEAGRIVNVGTGDAAVMSDSMLVNSGVIAGAGNLKVSAQTAQNSDEGKIDAGGTLLLTLQQQLDNRGAISSQGALDIAGEALALTNRGLIVSKGTASIAVGQIDNDHGKIATAKDSGADLVMHALDLHNLGGTILADGKATIVNAGAVNNDGGTIQSLGDMQVTAGATLSNNGGVIEAANAAASMSLRGQSIVNDAAGRIVNVGSGQAVLSSGSALVNSGLIAGNGSLDLAADTLNNKPDGTISSGAALGLAVGQQLDNAGIISSKGALTLNEPGSSVSNSGSMVAGGAFTLAAAHLANDGGQIATAKNSGAGITLNADSVSNRSGAILADGTLAAAIAGALDNGLGTVQAGKEMQLVVGGVLGNNAGVIESIGAASSMRVQAGAIDSLTGRIVNVGSGDTSLDVQGSLVSSGVIAGNGKLAIGASVLDNMTGGAITAGAGLAMTVQQRLGNAGIINSRGALDLHAGDAAVDNGGQIVVDGNANVEAGTFNNNGGQIVTVRNSGGDISLHAQSLANQGGTLLADGNANLILNGNLDNSQGAMQAARDLHVDAAGAVSNAGGTIESDGPANSMTLQAMSIDNGTGRIVNVGSGNTSLTSQSGILNSGIIAGNGDLLLGASSLLNKADGAISSGRDLELAISQHLDNQDGTIGSAGRLHFNLAGASLTNSGAIVSGGNVDVTANSVNNDGGQLVTVKSSGADITLSVGSLSNQHGVILADGSAALTIGAGLDNAGGTVQAGRDLQLTAAGDFHNSGGVIEAVGAASRLTLNAQSIANGNGRIVNVGTGGALVVSQTSVESSGAIAGNGNLTLDAATLQNGGSIGSGGSLELAVRQQLDNQGQLNSGGTLYFNQAGASFNNSGQIAAGGNTLIAAAHIDNHGGQISTVRGSGANITLSGALNNQAGAVLADGMGTYTVIGTLDNSAGTLHAGKDLSLTVSGALGNDGGHIEAVGTASALTVQAQSIDNASGYVTNVGTGDTCLTSAAGIANNGSIAAGGNLVLSSQTLDNQLDGSISAGRDLNLLITEQLGNNGSINSAGTLTFNQAGASLANSGQIISGGRALIVANEVNNNGGEISTGAGSGADLTLSSQQLSNQDGRILADGDLTVATHSMQGSGELFAGRDLALSLDGDYLQANGASHIHANRDLSLTVTGNITNAATFEAVRNLALTGNRITNEAGAVIQAQGVTLNAAGDLGNAGEINGAVALSLSSGGTISNSNGIVGGSVALAAQSLNNSGASALLGASGNMALLVSNQLNNTGGGTIYSTGDLTIAANAGGAGTAVVNNVSSTIEAAANLALVADTVNNVRENVVLTTVTTLDETTHMSLPSWYTHGDNNNYYDPASSNYQPHETYFVNPADILENSTYVTPDGYTIGRAVIRTHANDSAFFSAASSAYSSYGHSERISVGDGTRVLYYTSRSDNVANPDQGGAAANAYAFAESITNWNDAGPTFSSQYGNCGTDCVRFVTQPGYVDPGTTIQRDTVRALAPVWGKLEVSREAHHVVTEDQLAPGAGAPAQIRAGGNMHLTVNQVLSNRYSNIVAAGVLTVNSAAAPVNQGATLYRTHRFDGSWRTEDGTTVAYTMPPLSEVAGTVAGVISGGLGVSINARSFSNVDVSAGTVGNIRDSINVIGSGASGAGAVTGGPAGSGAVSNATVGAIQDGTIGNDAGVGTSASGSGLANNAAALGFSGSGLGNAIRSVLDASQSGASNSASARGALANSGGTGGTPAVSSASINGESVGNGAAVEIAPGGLFIKNPDANGKYLYETRPQFADHGKWVNSDYLLNALNVEPTATQKRLGDGFYEQRLVREQLGELTGRPPANGESDDSQYQKLLTNAVTFAKQYGLRPGIALSAEQMSRLTSDIVWLENQLVRLPDGSTQTVLVPKVYLAHVADKAIQPGGALVVGANVNIRTDEAIVNRGGVIDAGSGAAVLVSNQDIVNQGGSIGGGSVVLAAARDVRNESLAVTQSYASSQTSGSYTSLSNQAAITAGSALQISAGRDMSDVAGKIGAGTASISAARDVTFGTLQMGSTYQSQVAGYTENDSSVTHQLSQLTTAGNLVVGAGRDINLTGAQTTIGGNGALLAGRAVNISSVTNEVNTDQHNDAASKVYDKQIHRNQSVVGATIAAAGALQLTAGAKETAALNVNGSSIVAGGAVALGASGDVNIGGVQEQHVSDTASHRESNGFLNSSSSTRADYSATTNVVGSNVSGGSVAIRSGNDINISGSEVTAQNALTLAATRDLVVSSAQQTATEQHNAQEKTSGLSFSWKDGINLGTARQQQNGSSQSTTQVGSTLSGASVTVLAGRDILVQGSTVVADGDIALAAARDLSIVSAQNTSNSASSSSSTKSGLIGSFWQPAIGTVKSSQEGTTASVTQVGSQVASLGGKVTLQAGEQYTQTASKVIAPGGDIAIRARDVLINAGYDTVATTDHSAFSQVAIGGSVSMPLVNSVQGMAHLASAVQDTGDTRMRALAAVTAGMQVPEAIAGAQALANGSTGGFKISVSLGSTRSETRSTQNSSAAVGSQVAAGGNVSIVATGAGHASNLNVIGSEIAAGNNVVLAADNQVNLLAAENTASLHSSNSASGASIGVGIGFGGAQQGVSLELAANRARGQADGDDLSHSNTHVNAGNTVVLQSGGDTTLKGGVVAAGTVLADIGGNLNIQSLQDRSSYNATQSSAGFNASLCLPPLCYGASTVSASAGRATVNGDYLSVVEQSGIKAGDGGFQVAVRGNTDLIGGVIASSQAAIDQNKNSLTTGSLSYSALQNKDVYDAAGYAVNASVSGKLGDQGGAASQAQKTAANSDAKPGAAGGVGRANGSQSGVTQSGVSAGVMTITDAAKQAQTGLDVDHALAGIDRNVTTDSSTQGVGTLVKTWNGDKLMKEVQAQALITQAFSAQAPKVVAKYADDQAKALLAKADMESDAGTRKALQEEAAKWGESGSYRIALHTVSGALGGGVGGALGAGAAATAAKTLNDLQASTQAALVQQGMSPEAAKMAAQGIAEAASLGVGAALGGTAGAATALATDTNNRQLHDEEKSRIKQLAGKDPQKEARLSAAACAMVKCYAEFPVDSAAYQQLKQLADIGASDALAGERQQLSNQTGMFGYSTASVFSDRNFDAAKRFNNTYQIGTRVVGVGETALGGLGVAGSLATAPASCATGIGCVANAFVGTVSVDAMYAGAKQTISGNPESTYLNQGLQSLGMSPQAASLWSAALGIGSAATAGAVANKALDQSIALGKLSAASYQNFATNGVKVTPAVMQTPQAQALVREIQTANPSLPQSAVERFAKEYIESGSSLPRADIVTPGTTLVKVVPKGDSVSPYTGYWMSAQQAKAIAAMPPEQAGQLLGLPAAQAANIVKKGMDFYAITPKTGTVPNVFVSNVASTTQGAVAMPGNAQQVIVPNRNLWTVPTLVNPSTLRSTGGQ